MLVSGIQTLYFSYTSKTFSVVTGRKSGNQCMKWNLDLPIFNSMLQYQNLLKDDMQPVAKCHLIVQATS
jgi:hypothetical protein